MTAIDTVNAQILELFQNDGRMTNAKLIAPAGTLPLLTPQFQDVLRRCFR